MTTELATTYAPEEIEKKWYKTWESKKYFTPKKGKTGKAFSIIMPPPNVTGKLHMGHALDITTQDALTRFKRMKGFETLWLPGMDHAGIATQSVVEKMVYETEKKRRTDFTREEFLNKIWKWKDEYGGAIVSQLKTVGASCDWDRFIFTMDKEANEAVRKVFVDLFNQGLIYQANYIVNWDPGLESAISDAEVEHLEVKGAFYHILYPVKDSDIKLEVATTRPETMLGDTAVAVNPNDERYKHLIGKMVLLPLTNREIPIIGDEHVDLEFGTGCLKVTPGHDFNDFEIGKRHNLPAITILNKNGTLNDLCGEFKNLTVKKARPLVVEKLTAMNLFVKQVDHTHQVGHSTRSGAIIEPMISKQWFLKVNDMARVGVEAVKNDSTKFYPKGWENTYFAWLENPKDWCISRQLWWGHQIPVFTCSDCHQQFASELDQPICKCGSKNLTQDPDVLDTWFSSGLWPLSTLGWPNPERMKERGFDTFYPTSVLVTGFDIIFFWVARMMMMCMKTDSRIPFEKVYIHAIVRDKLGRKMSKSLGNGIDPSEMVKEYGADALRFTLAAGSGYNRNLNLDPERIAGFRNFINKIWNAYRFISPNLALAQNKLPELSELDLEERWILSELNETAKSMNNSLEEFRFDDSCSAIYAFIYDRFCSWFIELSKPILYGDNESAKIRRATVLKFAFRKIVALLHPISPYITEELWTSLKTESEDLLIVTEYPEFDEGLVFAKEQEEMSKIIEVVTLIRNLRSSVNIKPKDEIEVQLFIKDSDVHDLMKRSGRHFTELAKVKELKIIEATSARPNKSIFGATTFAEIFIPLEGVIDLSDQIKRIQNELDKNMCEVQKLEKKLLNESYVKSAPPAVVEESREKLQGYKEKVKSLEENLKRFK